MGSTTVGGVRSSFLREESVDVEGSVEVIGAGCASVGSMGRAGWGGGGVFGKRGLGENGGSGDFRRF